MKLKELIQNAQERYDEASVEQQKVLEIVFGEDTFPPKEIKKRVKTFEDACKVLSLAPGDVTSINDTEDEAAYKRLKVITKALNEGWEPDWDNRSEGKYYPWFYLGSSSGGFSCHDYAYVLTASHVGSRLCLKSRDLAIYAGKQFTEEYKPFMLIK